MSIIAVTLKDNLQKCRLFSLINCWSSVGLPRFLCCHSWCNLHFLYLFIILRRHLLIIYTPEDTLRTHEKRHNKRGKEEVTKKEIKTENKNKIVHNDGDEPKPRNAESPFFKNMVDKMNSKPLRLLSKSPYKRKTHKKKVAVTHCWQVEKKKIGRKY